MIKEAIDRVLGLAPPVVVDFDGRRYSNQPLTPIKVPHPEPIRVSTLTGLVGLVQADLNELDSEQCVAVVESPTRVTVRERTFDHFAQRTTHIVCELPDYGDFPFGQYLEQEEFLIGLQAFFVAEAESDMAYVAKVAGKLSAQDVRQVDDDGVSQNVTLKSGVVLAQDVAVRKLVTLRPWRTFREVAQPKSEFVFRLRNRKDSVPSLALHIADGELWQAEAMHLIRNYLDEHLTDMVVVG